MDGKEQEQQTFTGPRWAWDIIWETISNDTRSKAFDANLRAEIKKAEGAISAQGKA